MASELEFSFLNRPAPRLMDADDHGRRVTVRAGRVSSERGYAYSITVEPLTDD
jgi:hypothetical protein